MQPTLHKRMKELVAVIKADRGAAYGVAWYVQQCIDRCLKVDCEVWGISDGAADPSEDPSL